MMKRPDAEAGTAAGARSAAQSTNATATTRDLFRARWVGSSDVMSSRFRGDEVGVGRAE